MLTLTPTKATGGLTKVMPTVYAEPDRQMGADALTKFMSGTGMNSAFLAEMFSGMLAHERCGRHLYRACETRTQNPALQARYREFGAETERHVEILENLIADAGGSPMYVGPTARAVLGSGAKLIESTFTLGGSLDIMTGELAMLDAVFIAESMDHANWKLLGELTVQFRDTPSFDPLGAAVEEVEPEEHEHLTWAVQTKVAIVQLEAARDGTAMPSNGDALTARVREWLGG